MKNKLLGFLLLTLVLTFGGSLSSVHAQGTAFTYQGRFTDSGVPANATVEFQFTLWNALSGGTQVAVATPTSSLVGVTNGLFTTAIDFGAATFDGSDRYLQIEARTVLGPFTLLTPRQKISPTPYAMLAGKLNGTVTSGGLAGTYGSAVTFSNTANLFTGACTGNGSGLTNLVATSLGGLSASNLWQLGGNAGTIAGANFLGTSDNQPLELKANNQRVLRLESILAVTTSVPGGNILWSNAPNSIGGSPLNVVDGNAVGAFIGGGGLGGFYVDVGAGYVFGGTFSNRISAALGTIIGGGQNTLQYGAYLSSIGGGLGSTIQSNSPYSTIGGGQANSLQGNSSTIAGGNQNTIQSGDDGSVIGGGDFNTISNSFGSTIAGGEFNRVSADAPQSFIGGGGDNVIAGNAALTGFDNSDSAICGGFLNTISGNASRAFIGGGDQNTNYGSDGVICGGRQNQIGSNGFASTIVGGYGNTAAGNFSFAAGNRARAVNNGTFVWADSQNGDFSSVGINQFLIRAAGGVGIGTSVTPNGALHLHSGGLAVTGASSPYSGTGSGVYIESGVAIGNVYAFDYANFSPLPLLLNSPGGNVGIGRTPTVNTLEISGNASKAVAGSWLANSDGRI